MKILQDENHNFNAMKGISFSLTSFRIAKIDSEGKQRNKNNEPIHGLMVKRRDLGPQRKQNLSGTCKAMIVSSKVKPAPRYG